MLHALSLRRADRRPSATHGRLVLAVCCLVAFPAHIAFAQLPVTELSGVFPPGGKQGATVEVTVTGDNQDALQSMVFSHPGITATQKMSEPTEFQPQPQPVNNAFTVKIGADVAPGVYEARVIGRFGTSNPRAFVVGRYDELLDDGANKSLESAREIPVGTVVNGRVDASSFDYYKIPLKAGQRVIVDCWARRIDSRMDPALILYGTDGREIRRSRDLNGADPMIDFTAPQEGTYTVAIYDFLYGGGADYYYRLMVHSDPHIDFVFPPAGLPGTENEYTVYGRNLPGGKPDPKVKLGKVALEQATVKIALPNKDEHLDVTGLALPRTAAVDSVRYELDGSNPVTVAIAAAPVVTEQEPNNAPEQAQNVPVPCEYAGQFYPQRDDDWLQFEAEQGQVYWIDVISHREGIGTDPYMILQQVTRNEQGEEQVRDLAQVDDPADRAGRIGSDFDTSTDDPTYRFEVPADGVYRLMIRNQFGSGPADPRAVYRVRIRPEQPDFRLVTYPEQIKVANNNQVLMYSPVVRQGGTTLVKVEALRQDGFDGEIVVSVEGLPQGVTSPGAILGGNVNTAYLVFSAEENAPAWSGNIHIIGKAQINGKDVAREARAGTVMWSTANRAQVPPAFRLTRDLTLSVVDKDKAVAKVTVGDGGIVETSLGGKLDLPIKVRRSEGFKEALKLVATGLPNELKPGDVTINGDKAEGTLSIAVTNNNAKPGSYTFYLRSDTKYPKWERNPEAIAAAEAEQKRLEGVVNEVNEQVKQATTASGEATKQAQTAAANVKTAEQAKAQADQALQQAQAAEKQAADKLTAAKQAAEKEPENEALKTALDAAQKAAEEAAAKAKAAQEEVTAKQKVLEEAQAAAKQAEDAKAKAEQDLKDVQEKAKRATAAKAAADKTVADVKKANAPADVNIALVSTPIQIRVVPTPIALSGPETVTLKQGEKAEVAVSVQRDYGFEDQVDLTVQPPKGVAGLSAAKATIAKGQQEAKLELTAANNATVGEHTVTVSGQIKFNNITINTPTEILVKVEEAAQDK